MYEVYLDGELLYYPADEENILLSSKLQLELNTAGTFEFEVPPGNPLYHRIEPRRSMVQVLKDEKEIFYGEVREIEKDFYNVKQVSVTGELAFLFDSIQPQAEYHELTTRQILENWLNIHNSQVEDRKKFYVGIVTIHDSDDSLYRYTNRETTLDAIREKLIEKLNGYLRVRKVNGRRYLDWITQPEYGKYCEQPIEFGTNLLNYAETVSAEELATAVIPLGARLEESKIEALEAYTDITSVNGGKDYLCLPEAVENFGWVKKVIYWDDVTLPKNLKTKGEKWLKDNQYEDLSLTLTALDLSDLGNDYEAFEIGDTVQATAQPYGMDRTFPIRKMTIYLQEPDSNQLELGAKEKKTFSNQVANSNKHFNTELDHTRQTTAWLQSAIDNATAMMTGSKGGYKVTEFDDDGRWLRDLYMNAPSKEQATRLMQINMNGIGFSRDGFNGPYKNAWTIDGVFLGEFIKAGSVQAEALSAEYKASVTNAINTTVTAKFKVAENLISAEVKRATGQEVELAASIKVTSDMVQTKVTAGQVESLITQKADSIRLKANRIAWKSTYSSMTELGVLDCKSANIQGSFLCGAWASNRYYMLLEQGILKGGYNMNEYGYIDYSANVRNISSGQLFHGIQIQGGCLRISVDEMATRKTSNVGTIAYVGGTGSMQFITDIRDNGDGSMTWTYNTLSFENGLMVTDI